MIRRNLKHVYILSFLLAVLTFLTVVPGCADVVPRNSGEGAIRKFLEYVESDEYGKAWELLSASSQNTTDTPKTNRITQQEFIDKYTNIFQALEITAVEYSDITCSGGDILCSGSFKGVYRSEYIGDTEHDFRISAKREGGDWKIDWSPALIFPEMEWGDTVRIATLSAKRGDIVAENTVLATTSGYVSVYARVSAIEDEELTVSQLTRLLDSSESDVRTALSKPYDDIAVIKQYHQGELSPSVEEQLLNIKGIGVDYGNYGTYRDYPYGETLAHLIGYVGPVPGSTQEELEAEIARLNEGRTEKDGLYNADSVVGRLGLEKQYEKELRGNDGELIYICTAEGTNRSTIYKRPAQNGNDIMLSIDMALQLRLEEVMELILYEETIAGAVVVMDPTTGRIDAMSSYPSYDLNLFARGISGTDYNKLLNDPGKPLINRVTQGLYPPGSTMKAFTAAAVLDYGVMDTEYAFDESKIEEDYWIPEEYGAWIWSAIKRTHIKYPEDGPLNMRKAMIHSDNIYFANAALTLGWDNFMTYLERAGFRETIPFDISVSEPQLYNEDTDKSLKLLADSGYGQGEILVTPLQWASMFSAFANGGDIEVPYVVSGQYSENGILFDEVSSHTDCTWISDVVSDEAIATITPMLEAVVDPEINGTGRQLKVQGCKAAGKTGTAEIGNDKSREISWIGAYRVGVAPGDERMVMVMLEIPADEEFTGLKLDIARTMLSMDAE